MKPLILYLQNSGGASGDVLRAFVGAGFELEVLSSIAELQNQISRTPALVFFDFVEATDEATEKIIELYNAPELFSTPAIFLATDAVKRTRVLSEHFEHFEAVNVPYVTNNILTLALKLAVKASKGKTESEPVVTEKKLAVESEKNKAKRKSPSQVYRRKKLSNLNPAELISSHGGVQMATAANSEDFDDELLLPIHEKHEDIKRALAVMTAKDEWLGVHARRVAYVNSAITNNLGLGPERDAALRTAGLLMNQGLLGDLRMDLLRADLLNVEQGVIEELADAFLSSSQFVSMRLEDEYSAKIIEEASQLLLLKDKREIQDAREDTQRSLAVEIADRACWRDGYWDPFGAYRTLKSFKRGDVFQFSDEVTNSLAKVIGEASANHITIRGAFPVARLSEEKQVAESEKASEAFSDAEKLFGFDGLLNVPLSDLRSGMLLARPIVSNDGKVVLLADTRLTDDLIERIWMLSAIRPLQATVSVAIESSSF